MTVNSSPNYFVRILVVLLCILIALMILYNFLLVEPKGEINAGLVMLIAILLVVVLSESFDNFSIGKLLAVTRDNRRKETAINRLSGENYELRNQIVKIATTVNQSQSSTNVFGLSEEVIRRFIVRRASAEEIQERETEEASTATEDRPLRPRPDFRKIEEVALQKFLSSNELSEYSFITEAKLVTQFHGIDSISNVQPLFDAYLNTGEEEFFIEIRPSYSQPFMWRDRVYVMLNKIKLYRAVKKVNAHLSLVLVNIPEEVTDRPTRNNRANIEEYFQPAIADGLLRLVDLELTEEEARQCMRE